MRTYQRFYGSFEKGFMGFTTMGILGQSCLGSAAAMTVLMQGTGPVQMIKLFFVVTACMMFNGAVLAQQKPKTVFNLLIWSVAVSSMVIVAGLVG